MSRRVWKVILQKWKTHSSSSSSLDSVSYHSLTLPIFSSHLHNEFSLSTTKALQSPHVLESGWYSIFAFILFSRGETGIGEKCSCWQELSEIIKSSFNKLQNFQQKLPPACSFHASRGLAATWLLLQAHCSQTHSNYHSLRCQRKRNELLKFSHINQLWNVSIFSVYGMNTTIRRMSCLSFSPSAACTILRLLMS